MIIGVDEVGRGSWAGPLVVAAVGLHTPIQGLRDSKKLSRGQRELLMQSITQKGEVGIGWIDNLRIDDVGLSAALREATYQAVSLLTCDIEGIIIDGTINFLHGTGYEELVTTKIKADDTEPSVSAASIFAKVARDHFMEAQDLLYPGYNFKAHVGYGTKQHQEALLKLGASPLHRLSFKPLHKYRRDTK